MKTPRLWIGGQWVDTATTHEVLNPASGEVVAHVPLGDVARLDEAVAAAQKAFPPVRRQSAHERAALLHAIARGVEQRRAELADTIVAEAGKPITFADAEVTRAIATFTAAAEEARRQHGEVLDLDAF